MTVIQTIHEAPRSGDGRRLAIVREFGPDGETVKAATIELGPLEFATDYAYDHGLALPVAFMPMVMVGTFEFDWILKRQEISHG